MGRKQTHLVVLTPEEREYLIKNTKGGTWSPREVKRAQILLNSDNGSMHDREIAKQLHCYPATITNPTCPLPSLRRDSEAGKM